MVVQVCVNDKFFIIFYKSFSSLFSSCIIFFSFTFLIILSHFLLMSRNVLKEGFKNQTVLPQSDLFDCALCTCVADLDWDGQNELLIGTYGQVGPSCLYWSSAHTFCTVVNFADQYNVWCATLTDLLKSIQIIFALSVHNVLLRLLGSTKFQSW